MTWMRGKLKDMIGRLKFAISKCMSIIKDILTARLATTMILRKIHHQYGIDHCRAHHSGTKTEHH
jgi:hypothetical protein